MSFAPAPASPSFPPSASLLLEVAAVRACQRSAALVARADEIFERVSPYPGPALRNHCWRLYELGQLLLQRRGLVVDGGLWYLAAMVHDLGLVARRVRGDNYLERSISLVWRELGGDAGALVPPASRPLLEQCLRYNHRLRAPRGLLAQAEAFRCAVLVEHTRGVARLELDARAVRQVFERHPRMGFDRVLVDFARRVLWREPRTVVRGIFWGERDVR